MGDRGEVVLCGVVDWTALRATCSDLHFPVGQTVGQAAAQSSALEAQMLGTAVVPLLLQQPVQ